MEGIWFVIRAAISIPLLFLSDIVFVMIQRRSELAYFMKIMYGEREETEMFFSKAGIKALFTISMVLMIIAILIVIK